MKIAFLHKIPLQDLAAESIEARSLAQIESFVPQGNWSQGEWRVVCRMVHTCGDPSIAQDILFINITENF